MNALHLKVTGRNISSINLNFSLFNSGKSHMCAAIDIAVLIKYLTAHLP